jgi:HlyD family secretion protein
MVRTRVVDPQTGDETINQFKAAEASRDEARARAVAAEKFAVKAQAELGKATEDVNAAQADERVAAAEAARVQSLLGYRYIRAPFAGTVTRRTIDSGHLVQLPSGAKAEPLFTVVRIDTVRVPVDVPEADAAIVRKGAKAIVVIPALKAEITGEVARAAGALDPGSRTLRTEIDLPNPDGRLRPGMFATVRIVSEMPAMWVLPAAAVLKQADQTVVFLARDGKAVRLPVQPGRTDGTFTEVFKKQKAGGGWEDWSGTEDVLSGPVATLTDGQPIPGR